MSITILQTSDPVFYWPILAETSRTVRAYCDRNGLQYEQFVGIKRGTLPWQATYNRIYMLKEMLDRGIEGWVLYLDADAMIADQNFDLREYLWRHNHLAGIFAGYLDPEVSYTINAGGFAINLSHPVGRSIVLDYWKAIQAISDDVFQKAIFWEKDVIEDQYMLYRILRDYVENRNLGGAIRFERVHESFVNQGSFIRQRLRSEYSSFEQRVETINREVAEIMQGWPDARATAVPGTYLSANHVRIHTSSGLKRFGSIESIGQAGMLVYGPYVDLPAGRYVGRMIGAAKRPASGGQISLTVDVGSEQGTVIWASGGAQHGADRFGILVEQPFELTRDVSGLEFRMSCGVDQKIRVDAVQFTKVD